MTKLFPLKGKIQNYEWGGTDFIPQLLGFEIAETHYAEYWLGAHVNAPSKIATQEGEQPLDTFLKNDLIQNLGASVADRFGRLPFLFKVLDVHDMLSIQVHPTKVEAEKGFANENKLGVPIDAPNRNYKDDNHKPEIMVALGEFWLLHGFSPKDQLAQTLKNTSEFMDLLPVFQAESYYGLYKKVMEQSEDETALILRPLFDRIVPLYEADELDKSNPDYWAAKSRTGANAETPFDKGIFSIYFFNIVKLNKGEAIFQDAGVPHAYLEGQNMELMANSDNVLRGGLTSKYVDIPELLKHVSFEQTVPNVILGELQQDGIERIYRSSAPDFELTQIHVTDMRKYHSIAKTAQILFSFEGESNISEGTSSLIIKRGDAVFVAADCEYQISSLSSAIVYKATTP